MLSATNLEMRFGAKILFKNTNLQLLPGAHYGLVGANGSGKSTFLKVLTQEITAEAGEISWPNLTTVASMKQDHFHYDEVPILNVVLMGREALWGALKAKEKLLSTGDHFSLEECLKLEALEDTIRHHGGYQAESEAKELLEGLGIPEKVQKNPLKTLSGGFKLRVLLAQVLFSRPDVLALDEPTNHLDLPSINWLEGFLKAYPGTLILSSHDKHFLNAVSDHILDLDHQTITIYKGNFDAFEEIKTTRLEEKAHLLEKQEKRKEEMEAFVTRFKAKASKAKQAVSRMRMIEKLEVEMEGQNIAPSSRRYPHLIFSIDRPSGAIALKVKGISKAYGEKSVLKNVSFEIERGEKVAFVGANGIGKSTLLEIVTAHQKMDCGEVEWGHAAKAVYFPQDHKAHLIGDDSVIEWLRKQDKDVPEQVLRDILGKVLFSGDDAKKSVQVLSGGEAARLLLAKMMLVKQNALIFDEPTNHLDMESIEALTEALQEYEGTLLFVSHNQDFIRSLATRVIELKESGLECFKNGLEDYLSKTAGEHFLKERKSTPVTSEKQQAIKSYAEQKQKLKERQALEKLIAQKEAECQKLEKKLQQINEKMGEEGFYQKATPDEINKVINEKAELEAKLDEAFRLWEEAYSRQSDD